MEFTCDMCGNIVSTSKAYNWAVVYVEKLHPDFRKMLIEKGYSKKMVGLCQNCRLLDARLKVGTDVFSDDVIRQVELGLYEVKDGKA